MTIIQQLEQKGVEQSIKQGNLVGKERCNEKGRSEGKVEVSRSMLQKGVDRKTVIKMTCLTDDDLARSRHRAFRCPISGRQRIRLLPVINIGVGVVA